MMNDALQLGTSKYDFLGFLIIHVAMVQNLYLRTFENKKSPCKL